MSVNGRATFYGLKVFELGDGFGFEVSAPSVPSAQTPTTFKTTIGPPAKLRFAQLPSDNNQKDVYFALQPAVEVVDLGNNRVLQGLHAITLALVDSTDHLRGPKTKFTRSGLASFDRLRIRRPGYDKQLIATSPGLLSAHTPYFGVIPNGIPHKLRPTGSPQPATLVGQTLPLLGLGRQVLVELVLEVMDHVLHLVHALVLPLVLLPTDLAVFLQRSRQLLAGLRPLLDLRGGGWTDGVLVLLRSCGVRPGRAVQ